MEELKHKRDFYTCKRWRLLQYLMNLGFEPYEEMPDPTNYKYKWWRFKNTPELEAAIDAYFAER
jgi:hypothetical protein